MKSIRGNSHQDKKFVFFHQHAVLFVIPICVLVLNHRSRTVLMRLFCRFVSLLYHCVNLKINKYILTSRFVKIFHLWPVRLMLNVRNFVIALTSRRTVKEKFVSKVSAKRSDVILFSDDKQFGLSGRIPAYALTERRYSRRSIISIHEAKKRSMAINVKQETENQDFIVPELETESRLLSHHTLLSLCKYLPNRCIGYSWSSVYSTNDHGTSLKTMYRNMANIEAPVVLIIQDTNGHIFGALCSSPLKVSDHYYGTGESFLFTLEPDFEVFSWTGENRFFLKGSLDSLTIGGGKGTFGLWLDGDLNRGFSQRCETFNNKMLSAEEDFVLQCIEVWMIKDF